MGLNIKTEEAHLLAKELAELTGESMAKAVTEAMRLRVEELKQEKSKNARAEKIMNIARDMRSRMSEETLAMNLDDYLYDENGLPK